MGSRRLALAAVSVACLVAACGGRAGSGAGGAASPSPAPAPDVPVLQVQHVGGFLPVGAGFAQVPQLTVYPDGRAIVEGPRILVFPGPALPNLLLHRLDGEALDRLRALADDAGLLGEPPDYGDQPVADAATTVVTLRVGGRDIVHSAEALSLGTGPDAEPALPGLGPEAEAARAALSGFIDAAVRVVDASGPGQPHQPEAFAVLARPAPTDQAEPGPGEHDGPRPTVVPWPLPDVDLDAAADCLTVDGAAADTLRAALQDATELTRFDQDGQVHDVWARPLLPGEQGCR